MDGYSYCYSKTGFLIIEIEIFIYLLNNNQMNLALINFIKLKGY